jgi:5-amino-6-(5-phosphoribosylamino)uracil reductase
MIDWQERFERFRRRKEHEAIAAALAPYVTEVDTRDARTEHIGNPWTRVLFDGDFHMSPPPDPRRPACNLVFVQSKDGNTVASNPQMLGGGETDKHVIYEGLSRVAADAVLAGAETVRSGTIMFSVWHPELVRLRASLGKPRHPIQIVATLQGLDLDRSLLFNIPDVPAIVLTIGPAAILMQKGLEARPWVTSLIMPRASDFLEAFEQLRATGIERISSIGGRKIASQLIGAGLVQDLYLTTSPQTGGEPNTPIHSTPLTTEVVARKRGTGKETGVVFEHLRLVAVRPA